MTPLKESIQNLHDKLDFKGWLDLQLGRRYEPVGNPEFGEVELVEEKPKEAR